MEFLPGTAHHHLRDSPLRSGYHLRRSHHHRSSKGGYFFCYGRDAQLRQQRRDRSSEYNSSTYSYPLLTIISASRQTYFDHKRSRVDPVVCVNVLTLFYANGRGEELPRTFAWVREILINRGYTDGTRYYPTPECFLFFMARLLEQIEGTEADLSLRPVFRERVQERI